MDRFQRMQVLSDKIVEDAFQKRFEMKDNGGRRLGIERRVYSYSAHIPERRSDTDRRTGLDRRKAPRI